MTEGPERPGRRRDRSNVRLWLAAIVVVAAAGAIGLWQIADRPADEARDATAQGADQRVDGEQSTAEQQDGAGPAPDAPAQTDTDEATPLGQSGDADGPTGGSEEQTAADLGGTQPESQPDDAENGSTGTSSDPQDDAATETPPASGASPPPRPPSPPPDDRTTQALTCDVTVDPIPSPTTPAALIRIEVTTPADSVYLAISWPDGRQVLQTGLDGGRAQLRLPAPNGPPTVDVYATPELRPSERGCSSG